MPRDSLEDVRTARCGYTGAPSQQTHWRLWGGDSCADQPALICCHPGPFSGLAFQNLAPLLARNRLVIAPDYPGYGGSSPLAEPASIEVYVDACVRVAQELCGDEGYDLLGFHSGCIVAGEWAHTMPGTVRKLCLIDVPAFDEETSRELADQNAPPIVFDGDLKSLEPLWRKYCVSRVDPQGMNQALAMFTESLRAGPDMNDVFRAAFAYVWTDRFAQLKVETLVIGTQSRLLEGTREVAAIIPSADYIERLDITRSVLDEAAEEIARLVEAFLHA